jgi:glyoxylase-like metal-dependent hydrolase (beta-lactamase superfamily II)/8-oxo-dGTP pyrophosphatase MutT (NUDIX family)
MQPEDLRAKHATHLSHLAPPAQSTLRQAATLVLVRDGAHGLEVLLLKRAERDDNNGGAWVFPGGVVEASDASPAHAAIRECEEECSVRLDASQLVHAVKPLSRWITPVGLKKRFDTRFFLARMPEGQHVKVDGVEAVDHGWFAPQAPLARGAGMKLLTPTRATLAWLCAHATANDALQRAPSSLDDAPIVPRLGRDKQGVRPVTPDEPAYAELGHLDPQGQGTALALLLAGQGVHLTPRVVRVTAPNPGIMTGPGTNTYLVGGGPQNLWAVIDPGPDLDAHLHAIQQAAPGPIRWIFVTHTHKDHSPLAVRLAHATGAKLHGRVAAHAVGQDDTFKPDVVVQHNQVFDLDGLSLQALHTPGHATNHVCYALQQDAMLFTGDHLMQRSTVVINPPDGDMGAYIASLRLLEREHAQLKWLAPGHGFLMDEPVRVVQDVITHRLQREAKVVAALRSLAQADTASAPGAAGRAFTLAELVTRAYDDVHAGLHPLAQRSLLAHLLKLRDDGIVIEHLQGATSTWEARAHRA